MKLGFSCCFEKDLFYSSSKPATHPRARGFSPERFKFKTLAGLRSCNTRIPGITGYKLTCMSLKKTKTTRLEGGGREENIPRGRQCFESLLLREVGGAVGGQVGACSSNRRWRQAGRLCAAVWGVCSPFSPSDRSAPARNVFSENTLK